RRTNYSTYTSITLSLFYPLFLSDPAPHRHPHSFPTRRSSDLASDGLSHHPAEASRDSYVVSDHPYTETGLTPHIPPQTHSKPGQDRKSTRLNSSHVSISYAVFCLKKKTNNKKYRRMIEHIEYP